jgi:CBS domain containing-hemolysin-like protein
MSMNAYLVMLFCLGLAFVLHMLLRAYFYFSLHELHRRAGKGRRVYANIQLVAAYGSMARGLLFFPMFILLLIGVIIISREYDPIVAFFLLVLLGILFRFGPQAVMPTSIRWAGFLAPYFSKLLAYIEPVLAMIFVWMYKLKPKRVITRIYSTDDLKDLLQKQKKAVNNRIPHEILDSTLLAVEYDDKKIENYMVRREALRFVTPKDPIGPILISELHKSGLTCYPVQGKSDEHPVGMLYMSDLTEYASGGVVADAMKTTVAYVRQDRPLQQVLQAFQKTGQLFYLVIDSDQKITGMITVESALLQLAGYSIRSDFDRYDDPAKVAHH